MGTIGGYFRCSIRQVPRLWKGGTLALSLLYNVGNLKPKRAPCQPGDRELVVIVSNLTASSIPVLYKVTFASFQ